MSSGDFISSENQVRVLDQDLDLRENMRTLLEGHRSYVYLLIITILLDAASTIAFMNVLGPGAEWNPVVRHLSYSLGVIIGPPMGKLFQLFAACALTMLAPRLAKFILATVILVNLFAFVVNMHVFALAR